MKNNKLLLALGLAFLLAVGAFLAFHLQSSSDSSEYALTTPETTTTETSHQNKAKAAPSNIVSMQANFVIADK